MTNEKILELLRDIAEMTDDENPESYRSDDPRGCLDTIHSLVIRALVELGDQTYKAKVSEIERQG